MTIARDKTGAVVGQAVRPDPLTLTIGGLSLIRLLTKDGRYVTVPRSSVRLEVRT